MREVIFSSSPVVLTGLLATRSRERKIERQSAVRLEEVTSARRRNDILPDLEVRPYPIDRLKAPERELRKVTVTHVAEIADLITTFGFVKPLLVSDDGTIVDGVSSWQAARKLGLETVPCLTVDHLTKPELRRLRLVLNRLGEKGIWAIDELKIEFQELIELDEPLDAIGFSAPEIDLILTDGDGNLDPKANAAAEPDMSKPPASQAGNLWILGRHRVFCGNATDPHSYELFGDASSARLFSRTRPTISGSTALPPARGGIASKAQMGFRLYIRLDERRGSGQRAPFSADCTIATKESCPIEVLRRDSQGNTFYR